MIKIRRALLSDAGAVEKLEKLCFPDPWPGSVIESQISGDGKLVLIAEEDGSCAGFAGLQHVLDEGSITNVCTDPARRRRGIASSLLREIQKEGEALGLSFLTLEVRESNLAARALYSGLGYREAGLRKGYYLSPRENAVIMTLVLRGAHV